MQPPAYLWAVSIVALPLSLGCAPSHRMVHEGNGYFERCYVTDFDARRTREQRETCWNAWLAHYTRHQPAHRIDYAMQRLEMLGAGEATLPLPGQGYVPVDGADAGTTGFATAGLVTLHGARAGAEVSTLLDPSAAALDGGVANGCTALCASQTASCTASCPEGEAQKPCHDVCTRDEKLCLGGCY